MPVDSGDSGLCISVKADGALLPSHLYLVSLQGA